MSEEIYSGAFYDQIAAGSLRSARVVVPLALELLPPIRSVIDVGCGVGAWLSVFGECGVETVRGIDGAWVPRDRLMIPEDRFTPRDVAELEGSYDEIYDLAMSLEVAEHIAEDRAESFVTFLTSLAPIVLFSAAVPQQGGSHHVNEQWPAYWHARFAAKGFRCLDMLRWWIWEDDRVEWWYRQNVLLYYREDHPDVERMNSLPGFDRPAPVVHPVLWNSRSL